MARILVIEDDDLVRTMLGETLARAGHVVLEAGDGESGMQVCRSKSVDLAIVDIIMPEKEGLETIRELRRDHPAVQIIAVSGGGRVGPYHYLTMAERFGAHRCFPKPVDRDVMLAAVDELLGEGPGPGSREAAAC